ncbi:ABC transporter ATP-binding protein [Gemmiger formicilis]|uniref:ABC transporter ATP-binding protein n=1 Tax=Gemmiger formicilis TaxID=745368 RepID=UPI00195611BE|nr:ABC transporter ATP-binding protein [Gemmiger formicilis]MBM6898244.1 ABC transporter ATP-binding protein [Gemmiger formicilis]
MITVEHLTKRYGSVTAVDDISFTIEDGHIYGFLGPNGAGKSTTMNIMTGCLAATSGEVKIDGFDIFEQARQAKQCIGYLPEIPPLYTDETPEEYLRFVAEAKGIAKRDIPAEITRVMRETRLTEMGGRLIRNLSKGYRQRVGIAQALLGNPRYIILDEPTVGLDPLQIIEIRDLIRELGEKHTVILSSHILSEVQAICESVLIIAHGKLVAFDTPQNLELMLAANNRLTIVAETDEPGLRAILDRQKAVSDYTIETDDLPPVAAPAEKPAPQAEPAAPAETDAEPAAEEEQTLAAAPVELTEAVLPTAPATAPKVCKATLTLAGDPAEACRTLFFAFARAGCALLQMTPVRADLENIFIELTEDEPSGKEEPTHESRI